MESLSPSHSYDDIEGLDGIAHIDTRYTGRSIYTRFFLESDSYDNFHEQKSKIYKLFRAKDTLTLIHSSHPHKRWDVQTSSSFIIDNSQSPANHVFELDFISKSPYAYSEHSIVATKDTTKQDYYFLSTNQITGREQITNNRFIIFNDGDVTIDPRDHEMVISFKGASDKLRLVNNMDGSRWQYLGDTTGSDVLKLDTVYPYKNGVNVFDDTNYGAITLVEGSNEIQVFGATGDYEIMFEYRPLYI